MSSSNLNVQMHQLEKLIQDTKMYVSSLKNNRIVQTPQVLAGEALRSGLSRETFDRYISYCDVLNEQVSQNISVYMEKLCIPFLERVLEQMQKACSLK